MSLTIHHEVPGELRISVSGDLDLASAAHLHETADQALADHECHTLILDLAHVSFIDSSGLSAILVVRNSTLDRRVRLRLRAIPRPVQRILQLSSLDQVFEIEPG